MFWVKLRGNLVVASDCYIFLNKFQHVFIFYIFHITWSINYNWSLLKTVNVLYVYAKVKRLQKLANQSLLNGTLVMEMVNNSFSVSKKNIGRLIKWKKFYSKVIKDLLCIKDITGKSLNRLLLLFILKKIKFH